MAFPIEALKIDFDTEIEYGQDQAFISYPVVFPTVGFGLQSTDELISMADMITGYGKDANYEFLISINDFTPSKVDSCIMFFVDMEAYSIDLTDEELPMIFDALDSQCREKLGKGCLDLRKKQEEKCVTEKRPWAV